MKRSSAKMQTQPRARRIDLRTTTARAVRRQSAVVDRLERSLGVKFVHHGRVCRDRGACAGCSRRRWRRSWCPPSLARWGLQGCVSCRISGPLPLLRSCSRSCQPGAALERQTMHARCRGERAFAAPGEHDVCGLAKILFREERVKSRSARCLPRRTNPINPLIVRALPLSSSLHPLITIRSA